MEREIVERETGHSINKRLLLDRVSQLTVEYSF